MNNKEKQIEEMAKIIDKAQKQGYQRIFEETRNFVQENHRYSSKNDYDKAHSQTIDEIIAEALYNAGYRKVNDDEVVVIKQGLIDSAKLWVGIAKEVKDTNEEIRKETAREFATKIQDYLNNKFCEEWGDSACDMTYLTIDVDRVISDIFDIAEKFGVEVEYDKE